jgi:hypothetical protein
MVRVGYYFCCCCLEKSWDQVGPMLLMRDAGPLCIQARLFIQHICGSQVRFSWAKSHSQQEQGCYGKLFSYSDCPCLKVNTSCFKSGVLKIPTLTVLSLSVLLYPIVFYETECTDFSVCMFRIVTPFDRL